MEPMKDFGKGWMTGNAQDLCKIMFVLGNVDPMELIKELGKARNVDRQLLNVRSIESALFRMRGRELS